MDKQLKSERFPKHTLKSGNDFVAAGENDFVNPRMKLAKQIAAFMNEKKISYTDLAKDLGKHRSEISKWLSGNHNFTLNTIIAIERALSIRIICDPIITPDPAIHSSHADPFTDRPENSGSAMPPELRNDASFYTQGKSGKIVPFK